MTKARFILISLSFAVCLSLTACAAKNNQNPEKNNRQDSIKTAGAQKTEKPGESDDPLKQYKAFLQDEISSETKSDGSWYFHDYCNIAVPGEDDKELRYALYDMTGDGLPELHVLTDISYSVHTIRNGQLTEWFGGDRHCRPLNNGAILEKLESTGIHYGYTFLDQQGNERLVVGFSSPPKGAKKGVYQYFFGTGDGDDYHDITLSKKQWKKLTKPFLAMGDDQIIWKKANDLDF